MPLPLIWFQALEGSSYVCLNILKTKTVCNTHPIFANTHTQTHYLHKITHLTVIWWAFTLLLFSSCWDDCVRTHCSPNQQRGSASTCLIRLHVLLWFERSMSGSVHLQTPKNFLKVEWPLTLMNCGKYFTWGSHGETTLTHVHMHRYLTKDKHMWS